MEMLSTFECGAWSLQRLVFVCIRIWHMIQETQVHLINSGFKQNARVHAFRDAGVQVFTPFRMHDPKCPWPRQRMALHEKFNGWCSPVAC